MHLLVTEFPHKDLEPLIGGSQRSIGQTSTATFTVVFEHSKVFDDLSMPSHLSALGLESALREARCAPSSSSMRRP